MTELNHMMDQMIISLSKLRSALVEFLEADLESQSELASDTRDLVVNTEKILNKVINIKKREKRNS